MSFRGRDAAALAVIGLVLAAVLAVTVVGVASAVESGRSMASRMHSMPTTPPTPVPSVTRSRTAEAAPPPIPAFDKAARSIDDPASIWAVVNKRRPLNPVDYAPADLVFADVPYVNRQPVRQEAADALAAMFAAGGAETGLGFQVESAYRDYDTQVNVYNRWVDQLGQVAADATSARPGTSEHQTGLAVDISSIPAVCPVQMCFADTPQAVWLAANAWRFGFILRYPGDKSAVGYEFEPYHFRFVGSELATEMHVTGVSTLEEFFGLPAAPDYGP